jgi:hypothetical protein
VSRIADPRGARREGFRGGLLLSVQEPRRSTSDDDGANDGVKKGPHLTPHSISEFWKPFRPIQGLLGAQPV